MKKITPIFIIIVVLAIVGIAYAVTGNHKSVSPAQTTALPPQTTPVASPSPTTQPTTSGYSADTKARVRTEFVNTCVTKGHYSNSECNCAALYLANNYSETELAKMYIQYHSTSKVPAALEAAEKVCVKK